MTIMICVLACFDIGLAVLLLFEMRARQRAKSTARLLHRCLGELNSLEGTWPKEGAARNSLEKARQRIYNRARLVYGQWRDR